ncbi:MAG TPA: hypothetical protein VF266_23490 [Thermoanaerobaculia bacterium]
MANLVDFLTYLLKSSARKRERLLTIVSPSAFVRRLLRRSAQGRGQIPYPRGLRGGYLIPYLVIDRGKERVVEIECYPPTPERPYYLPISPELTLLEISAIAMYRPTRMYALAKTLTSCTKRGGKLVFDTAKFITYDLPRLDEDHDAALDDGPPPGPKVPPPMPFDTGYRPVPGVRAGRHKPGCPRTETWGPCPVDDPPKEWKKPNDRKRRRGPKWTSRNHGPRRSHTADAALAAAQSPTEYQQCLPARPTRTEARLWRLAGGDPVKYGDLAMEYSDEIEADREAGRFEVKK